MSFPYYAVDLDGTLAQHSESTNILDIGKPVPLMLQRVLGWVHEGKEVRIVTARVNSEDNPHADRQRAEIEKWLRKYIGQVLPITCKKSHNMMQLWDDKAIQVIPNTGEPVFTLDGQLLSADPEDLHCSAHAYHSSGCSDCAHKAFLSSYVRDEKLQKVVQGTIHRFEIVPSAPSPKIQLIKSQLNRKLYVFLYNSASDVATALRKNYVSKADEKKKKDELFLLAWGAINWELLSQEIYQDLYEIAKIGASEGLAQLDLPADESEKLASDYATKRVAEMIGEGTHYSIADTTKEDLQSIIEVANQQNISEFETANQIKASKAFSKERAELIADTESVMAHVYSHFQVWKNSGRVKKVSIVLSPDHDVEDECDDVAGLYEIESCPTVPLHPNCRCSIVVEELK